MCGSIPGSQNNSLAGPMVLMALSATWNAKAEILAMIFWCRAKGWRVTIDKLKEADVV